MLTGLLLASALSFGPTEEQDAFLFASNLVVACTPRDGGTPGAARAADWIVRTVASEGVTLKRDAFEAATPRGVRKFANLVCEFCRDPSAPWTVLVSHYDTKCGTACPGANDGAATSGLLLALAKSWTRGQAPRQNVMLLWTDGEECYERYAPNDGLWGSRHAAARFVRERRKISAVVCLDMLGDRDLDAFIPLNGSPAVASNLVAAAKSAGLSPSVLRRRPVFMTDDHVPFLEAGFPAADVIDFSYGPGNAWWHAPEDTVDKISPESLEKAGRLIVSLLELCYNSTKDESQDANVRQNAEVRDVNRVAIVGFGFMGKTHYGAWKKCPGAKVVAVCDRNLAQLTAKVEGNIRGAADNSALPEDVRVYDDFQKMMAAGGLDIVDITLPTPLHAPMSIAALDAGCHVLCEKPMALTLADCDAMLAAAERAKRELLIAQCVRFTPEYAHLRELAASGRYGKIVAADFTRFMSAPKWSPKGGSWLLDETKSGGLYLDAHVHDADYIISLLGYPKSVSSRCHRSPHGYVDHLTTVYDYGPDGPVVTSDCSFAATPTLLWDAAARVFFERATVFLGPAYKSPLAIYPESGGPIRPELSAETGYEAEVRYFLARVEGRDAGKVLTARDAREAVRLVLAERESAAK